MTNGRWAFLTFGAGLPNWRGAARRLGAQARESSWFDETVVATDRDLWSRYPEFAAQNRKVLNLRTRGYGYWIWKPFLLRELLRALDRSYDGILYADAGCELNSATSRGRARWADYLGMARQNGLFAMHLPRHPEHAWSRLITMNCLQLDQVQRESPQNQATILVATRERLDLIDAWLETSIADNYRYVRDGPSSEVNALPFRAHRHDQSIFSGLVKQAGIATIPDETFWAPNWAEAGAAYPIWAPRNRTRVPIVANDPGAKALRIFEKTYSRGALEVLRRWPRRVN